MVDLDGLIAELTDDPLTRGYSGMSNAEVVTSLYAENRTVERASLSSAEVYNSLDPTEFQALSDAQKGYVRDILGLGSEIDVRAGTNARTVLLALFDAQSTTRSNLVTTLSETVSRAVELGLGPVDEGWVGKARA